MKLDCFLDTVLEWSRKVIIAIVIMTDCNGVDLKQDYKLFATVSHLTLFKTQKTLCIDCACSGGRSAKVHSNFSVKVHVTPLTQMKILYFTTLLQV